MAGTYLRVGLLLTISLAVAVALVLFLGRNRVSDGIRFETYFSESVQGLDVGAPVKYRGVTLGQVDEISLVSTAYMRNQPTDLRLAANRLVLVRFVLDPRKLGPMPNSDTAVAAGLRTRLAAQGITGLAYVELDFVSPIPKIDSLPWKPQELYIPSVRSTIGQFQDAAQALASKLQDVDIPGMAATFQKLMQSAQGQLDGGDLGATIAEARATLGLVRAGLEAANLPALTADLQATAAALRATVDSKQTRELLAATTRAADRLAESTARLPALVAALEATARRVNHGTADAQSELGPTLRDARAAAASLRETAEALRRYPAGVLLGGPPPRTRP